MNKQYLSTIRSFSLVLFLGLLAFLALPNVQAVHAQTNMSCSLRADNETYLCLEPYDATSGYAYIYFPTTQQYVVFGWYNDTYLSFLRVAGDPNSGYFLASNLTKNEIIAYTPSCGWASLAQYQACSSNNGGLVTVGGNSILYGGGATSNYNPGEVIIGGGPYIPPSTNINMNIPDPFGVLQDLTRITGVPAERPCMYSSNGC